MPFERIVVDANGHYTDDRTGFGEAPDEGRINPGRTFAALRAAGSVRFRLPGHTVCSNCVTLWVEGARRAASPSAALDGADEDGIRALALRVRKLVRQDVARNGRAVREELKTLGDLQAASLRSSGCMTNASCNTYTLRFTANDAVLQWREGRRTIQHRGPYDHAALRGALHGAGVDRLDRAYSEGAAEDWRAQIALAFPHRQFLVSAHNLIALPPALQNTIAALHHQAANVTWTPALDESERRVFH